MIGAKRRNVSLSSNSDELPFHKRVAPQSPFGSQRTTPVEVEEAAAPSLDRRKAAQRHVRALNTEFASWVQSQLRDHPDELWEDGVKDYLTHASDILEKFTDVINWLKSKSVIEGSVSTHLNHNIENENGPEIISKENSVPVKSMFGMPSQNVGQPSLSNTGASTSSTSVLGVSSGSSPWGLGLSAGSQSLLQSSSSGLGTSWNPGVLNTKLVPPVKTFSSSSSPAFATSTNNQTSSPMTASTFTNSSTSGFFSSSVTPSFGATPSFAGTFANSKPTFTFGGSQSSAQTNNSAKGDDDEENEPEQPSSPSLKSSEEKGIVVVHETKCKLFLKSTDPTDKGAWKDKGTGQLFIKCEEGADKGTKESKPRILIRNDIGRIMLNASLYAGIKTNCQKNSIVAIFHTLDENAADSDNAKTVARTFLIRTKNEEECNKLAAAIREHAPAV